MEIVKLMTRKGKIARLPRVIREQLNERLANGEMGTRLVAWLNELPEVRKILTEQFGGQPINKQNLSNWKLGGYVEWFGWKELKGHAEEVANRQEDLETSPMEHMATLATVEYVATVAMAAQDRSEGSKWEFAPEWKRRIQPLRTLIRDVAELRRGDQRAARIKLDRQLMLAGITGGSARVSVKVGQAWSNGKSFFLENETTKTGRKERKTTDEAEQTLNCTARGATQMNG